MAYSFIYKREKVGGKEVSVIFFVASSDVISSSFLEDMNVRR